MEKYSSAVSEMYSQFKKEAHPFEKKEAHPLEKYIGRLANCYGAKVEVVGYCADMSSAAKLILDASELGSGWSYLDPSDVVFKKCKFYSYAGINNLID